MRRTRHANPAPKLTLTASPTASPKIRSHRRPVPVASLAVTRGVGPEGRTRLGYDRAPVSRADHARGPAQINPFGSAGGAVLTERCRYITK